MRVAMKRLGGLLLGFGYMVLLIEAVRSGVAWWNGDSEHFGLFEWAALVSLPVVAWIWWRYLSPFAGGRGKCLLPESEESKRR